MMFVLISDSFPSPCLLILYRTLHNHLTDVFICHKVPRPSLRHITLKVHQLHLSRFITALPSHSTTILKHFYLQRLARIDQGIIQHLQPLPVLSAQHQPCPACVEHPSTLCGEEGKRAGCTVWLEPLMVSPSFLQIQEFKECKSLRAMRSFRGHFTQPPPQAGIFFSFPASAGLPPVKGSSQWGETALPSLDSSYYQDLLP